ncbi:uncharacterized protein BO87DRAFT_94819 [Aspergillus neoniger CBS 115656]|uniref:Uncharacterized protein n=1 Tax=Aspergillus neoniger (strain CBS 115656) TaxID=1448310 RepID=A0A318YGB1_ASPNB|nr:hypothetical protein BO87DRAFT_94819 [Aspergillus neoniger CBS 115656]PYH33154.1 hypothetical protein BO87DRAFT_94819 [Aspergillus neoniger CBS 115656]
MHSVFFPCLRPSKDCICRSPCCPESSLFYSSLLLDVMFCFGIMIYMQRRRTKYLAA